MKRTVCFIGILLVFFTIYAFWENLPTYENHCEVDFNFSKFKIKSDDVKDTITVIYTIQYPYSNSEKYYLNVSVSNGNSRKTYSTNNENYNLYEKGIFKILDNLTSPNRCENLKNIAEREYYWIKEHLTEKLLNEVIQFHNITKNEEYNVYSFGSAYKIIPK